MDYLPGMNLEAYLFEAGGRHKLRELLEAFKEQKREDYEQNSRIL